MLERGIPVPPQRQRHSGDKFFRGGLEWGVKTNLIFGVGSGDSCQDGFDGTKHFGFPIRNINVDRGLGTPKSLANPISFLN